MIFQTEKTIKLASGAELKRRADVTCPDASTMFPTVTDANCLKLAQLAIVAQARANAGNALRSLTAGLSEADTESFKALTQVLNNLQVTFKTAPDALIHVTAAIWAIPENAKFRDLSEGKNIPTQIAFALTADEVIDRLSKGEVDSNDATA